ncbi:MAG: 3-isopropylmalate dehydratase small subunit [Desulfosarcina sp.]|nr:3-isopropylmalate dehydratase small subunit [Desulfosarcina sp.]MBC2743324.1 3-isopropylmalate dehydratase small subunit [Desulfosarcina sp.]MBC2766234.1 3-isopropylmalate dehydratase small subunit [Desulfosarcina sp.]
MKSFSGKALFLDRSDINTDEIIPAKYLTEISRDALAPYLLEDLKFDGFDPTADIADKSVVVTRANFGCGSSREHAPWALEVNGINLVVAESFARIFRQNMFNCGMMAVELPVDTIDKLFSTFGGHDTTVETDVDGGTITVSAEGMTETISFTISRFDADLVASGGWVDFADANY